MIYDSIQHKHQFQFFKSMFTVDGIEYIFLSNNYSIIFIEQHQGEQLAEHKRTILFISSIYWLQILLKWLLEEIIDSNAQLDGPTAASYHRNILTVYYLKLFL